MNDREEWRKRVRDIRATSPIWWWWWYIYIYIYVCVCVCACVCNCIDSFLTLNAQMAIYDTIIISIHMFVIRCKNWLLKMLFVLDFNESKDIWVQCHPQSHVAVHLNPIGKTSSRCLETDWDAVDDLGSLCVTLLSVPSTSCFARSLIRFHLHYQ